jgi:hypothetical protein
MTDTNLQMGGNCVRRVCQKRNQKTYESREAAPMQTSPLILYILREEIELDDQEEGIRATQRPGGELELQ